MQKIMGEHLTYAVQQPTDPAERDRPRGLSHRALYILGWITAAISALFLATFLATLIATGGIKVEFALIWITLFAVPAVLSGLILHLAAFRRDGAEAQHAGVTHGAWEETRLGELGNAIAALAEGLRDLKMQLKAAREDRKAIQEQQARIVARADRLEMWLEHMRPVAQSLSARVPELRDRQDRAEDAIAGVEQRLTALAEQQEDLARKVVPDEKYLSDIADAVELGKKLGGTPPGDEGSA
jgi:predicted  nucleic acid-binding Zn-ribbon protein